MTKVQISTKIACRLTVKFNQIQFNKYNMNQQNIIIKK